MFQPDLFTKDMVVQLPDLPGEVTVMQVAEKRGCVAPSGQTADSADMDLPALLERLAAMSTRPRYTFMVLNLIARAAGASDSAGPYVREKGEAIPVRDWLSDAMLPMAQRDARRLAVVEQVRLELEGKGLLPPNCDAADRIVAEEVRKRLVHSGRTNVSRAVSDLVRAGMLQRHYQGYRVDHRNRGGRREAVYTIAPAVQRALGKAR